MDLSNMRSLPHSSANSSAIQMQASGAKTTKANEGKGIEKFSAALKQMTRYQKTNSVRVPKGTPGIPPATMTTQSLLKELRMAKGKNTTTSSVASLPRNSSRPSNAQPANPPRPFNIHSNSGHIKTLSAIEQISA